MRTDSRIYADIIKKLESDIRFDASHIMVSVQKGIVKLTGRVNSYLSKLLVQNDVRAVPGVKKVSEKLRTNSDIAQVAWDALDWSLLAPGDNIQVSADNGIITVTGTVSHNHQRERVISTLHALPEVLGVINCIHIKPSLLQQDAEPSLERKESLNADKVLIEITRGHVVLRGAVRSWQEYEEAEKAVRALPGVTHIDNCMIVSLVH